MIFKKDTLTDSDKVIFVNTIAFGSIVKYFSGQDLMSANERSIVANELMKKLNGGCSTWTKSKLTAYADNIATSVVKTPILHETFKDLIINGALEEATDRLSNVTFNGLTMNGFITGSSSTFGAEPYMDELDIELKKIMLKGELKELEGDQLSNQHLHTEEPEFPESSKNKPVQDEILPDDFVDLLTPKRAYFSKNFSLKWMVKKHERVEAGNLIYSLADGTDIFEYAAEYPCKLIHCEEYDGAKITKSDLLLGRLKKIGKSDELPKTDLHEKLQTLKALYEDGLISEIVYDQKQKQILDQL